MGHSETAGAGAPPATLDQLLARAKAAGEAKTVTIPIIGDVTLQPAMRADLSELITEDSEPDEDQLHILAATVREPAFTADEWRQFRDAAPLGVWGSLMVEVMAVNGSDPAFIREQAARFRKVP